LNRGPSWLKESALPNELSTTDIWPVVLPEKKLEEYDKNILVMLYFFLFVC
jgi:hypothetical protein